MAAFTAPLRNRYALWVSPVHRTEQTILCVVPTNHYHDTRRPCTCLDVRLDRINPAKAAASATGSHIGRLPLYVPFSGSLQPNETLVKDAPPPLGSGLPNCQILRATASRPCFYHKIATKIQSWILLVCMGAAPGGMSAISSKTKHAMCSNSNPKTIHQKLPRHNATHDLTSTAVRANSAHPITDKATHTLSAMVPSLRVFPLR